MNINDIENSGGNHSVRGNDITENHLIQKWK